METTGRRRLGRLLAAALLLAGCGVVPTADGIALPPTRGGFDYQLGGAYPTEAAVVVRDVSAEPLPGAYTICYINGFQSQPDQAEIWLARPELLLADESGGPVNDPDWPDEYVLDPSTPTQRSGILELLAPLVTQCAEAGFDAVEIDNLDTWTRFPAIDEAGARALAAEYVSLAHGAGLAIAQKNAAEIAGIAHEELGIDFAIVEECGAYQECSAFTDVYGVHVLQIEYPDSLAEAGMSFQEVCALADRAPLTILRDRDLVADGEPGYVIESC